MIAAMIGLHAAIGYDDQIVACPEFGKDRADGAVGGRIAVAQRGDEAGLRIRELRMTAVVKSPLRRLRPRLCASVMAVSRLTKLDNPAP
jgi:hypothetical protein